MFEISLSNNKKFSCDDKTTIFDAARNAGISLEHSCLNARCSSCTVKIISGETKNIHEELVLTDEQKKQNFVLSCNSVPKSNLILDAEDLSDFNLFVKKIVPAKINSMTKINSDVIKLVLRLPPQSNFQFKSGQYVNLKKGSLKRSYSIANNINKSKELEFFIKKFENGLMSKYWFNESKINDLLMIEGPIGSFFLRDSSKKNIIFLATGTGIAPIKSILESILQSPLNYKKKEFWIFVGARYEKDLLWAPELNNNNININYIPVLSRQVKNWKGEKGYVQNAVLHQNINLEKTQVYACGSNEMIKSAKKILIENSLKEDCFFSDAFVATN